MPPSTDLSEAIATRLESDAEEATRRGGERLQASRDRQATEEEREAAWLALPVAERVRLGVIGSLRGCDPRSLVEGGGSGGD